MRPAVWRSAFALTVSASARSSMACRLVGKGGVDGHCPVILVFVRGVSGGYSAATRFALESGCCMSVDCRARSAAFEDMDDGEEARCCCSGLSRHVQRPGIHQWHRCGRSADQRSRRRVHRLVRHPVEARTRRITSEWRATIDGRVFDVKEDPTPTDDRGFLQMLAEAGKL